MKSMKIPTFHCCFSFLLQMKQEFFSLKRKEFFSLRIFFYHYGGGTHLINLDSTSVLNCRVLNCRVLNCRVLNCRVDLSIYISIYIFFPSNSLLHCSEVLQHCSTTLPPHFLHFLNCSAD
jgi:hypothetical protein